MRVLILGCGYIGLPLGAELVRLGHDVVGLGRSAEGEARMRAVGVSPVIGDLTGVEGVVDDGRFDWVVFAAAGCTNERADAVRALRVEGLSRWIARGLAQPPKRFVYLSSKAVYGQDDGSLVKETSETAPRGALGRVWLEAENRVLESARAWSPVVLRMGDVYGPGRERYVKEFASNRLKIPGVGNRYLNMIHRDDAVSAALAALKSGRSGERYNTVDDEPVRETQFFSWLSETLGKRMPPNGPDEGDPETRKELSNCRVSNRRLTMELGCRLRYPNFRLGYTAEIKRMTDDGSLEILPDER